MSGKVRSREAFRRVWRCDVGLETQRDPGLPTNGTPRHPQLALGSSGQNAVVWDEQTGGARRVVLGCGVGDEKHVRLARVSITEDRGTYPAIASLADDAVMVWTSGPVESSVLRIARAGAR